MFRAVTLAIVIFSFNVHSYGSSITQTANPTVVGCPDTFSTSIVGTTFQWTFAPNGIPPTYTAMAGVNSASTVFTYPGTYEIYVNVDNGAEQDSLSVTVQPGSENVSLTYTPDTVCAGNEINFTASPAGYQKYYFYVNGILEQATTGTLFTPNPNLSPGDSVWVLGFDGHCYTNPSPVAHPVVIPNPAPATLVSSVPSDTICGGDTITFTATGGYNIYSFQVGGSIQSVTPSNTYTTAQLEDSSFVSVTVTENGCKSGSSNRLLIIVKPTPEMSLFDTLPSCQGGTVNILALFVDIPGHPSLDNYTFFVNSTIVQNNPDSILTTASLNNGDIVTVLGTLQGCTSQLSAPLVVTVNPIPVVTLASNSMNDTICQGQSVQLTATPGAYNEYQFFRDNASVQNTSDSTYTTTTLQNGDSVYVQATNRGCVGPYSDTIVFVVNPLPAVTVGSDTSLCLNAPPYTLTGFTPPGGEWTGPGITDTSDVFSPGVAGAGVQTLVYTYTDETTGCSNSDSVQITVDTLPNPGLAPAVNLCEGQSTQLNAYGGTTYVWTPATDLNNPNISNPVTTSQQNIVYTVSVTDNNGCSDTASVTIAYIASQADSFTTNNACAGTPILFGNENAVPGSTYVWYFGDGSTSTDENPVHLYNMADTFNVTLISTTNGCPDTFSSPVVVFPTAVASFNASPTTTYNDASDPVNFMDYSTNATSYVWDFGDQSSSTLPTPSHVYQYPGLYTVSLTVTNQYGCGDSMVRPEYIEIFQYPKVFIPNIFSPNGDGNNDVLKVFANGVTYFEWNIYDRWGEKVYASNDPLAGWDGSFRGKPETPGVFAYYLKIVFEDETSREFKGSVTLVR